MGCLYIITSPSGKQYVGITSRTAEERWKEHCCMSRPNVKALHRAIKKYGEESFDVKTLVVANDWGYLCHLEQKAIKAYKTFGNSGYNMTPGGDGVTDLPDDVKELHRRNTRIGTLNAWAKPERKEKQRAIYADAEFKERHREATRAGVRKMYEDPAMREKIVAALTSDEKRQKNRDAAISQWQDPEFRAVYMEARKRQPKRTEESKRMQSEKMKRLIAERKAAGTYKAPSGPPAWARKKGHNARRKKENVCG